MSLYTQEEIESYAELLVWAMMETRPAPLRKGEAVMIRYDHQAMALVEAIYSHLMDMSYKPVPVALPTAWMEAERFMNSSYGQLVYSAPGQAELFEAIGGGITILAPEDLTHLQGVDPQVIAEAKRAEASLRSILSRRKLAGNLGWTTCLYPTEALAQASGMSLGEYAQAVFRACWLNMPSPVKEWKRIRKEMAEIIQWLHAMEPKWLKVESDTLELSVPVGENRQFIGFSGYNIPGSEIYFAPDCRGVKGVFTADQPSLRMGHLVMGARLEFYDGVTASVSAERGEVFLQRQLYTDAGARRVGEFSLTDKRFSRVDQFMAHTLLDENHGGEFGNCHIALGGSVLESFSGPRELLTPQLEMELGFNSSDIHWDLVNTGPKRVTAWLKTGEPRLIYENGHFII